MTRFLVLVILLTACISPGTMLEKMEGKEITVTGYARNAKEGAVVQLDTQVFYIDGLDAWSTAVLDKRVKVTGTLRTITSSEKLMNEKGEYMTGSEGERKVLENAKWVEEDG